MQRTLFKLAPIVAALGLAACGGGGSDSSTAPAAAQPTVNPNAYPSAVPATGDYFVYSSTTTPSLPAGQPATLRTTTRTFALVNADRSFTRADTSTSGFVAAQRQYAPEAGLLSHRSGSIECTYAPAYQIVPVTTSVVGDRYSTSADESCVTQVGGTPTTNRLSLSGTVEAAEARTLPIGTFDTIRYTQTIVTPSATATTTTVETCWIDKATGRAVECAASNSTVLAGQSAPSALSTSTTRLEAYSFHGQAPVGAAVRRFTGAWNVAFTGGSTGDCTGLQISTTGEIAGTCRFVSAGGAATSFTVTGRVDAAGVASVVASTGATLSGSFATAGAASGTWVNGGISGNWTAAHQ